MTWNQGRARPQAWRVSAPHWHFGRLGACTSRCRPTAQRSRRRCEGWAGERDVLRVYHSIWTTLMDTPPKSVHRNCKQQLQWQRHIEILGCLQEVDSSFPLAPQPRWSTPGPTSTRKEATLQTAAVDGRSGFRSSSSRDEQAQRQVLGVLLPGGGLNHHQDCWVAVKSR